MQNDYDWESSRRCFISRDEWLSRAIECPYNGRVEKMETIMSEAAFSKRNRICAHWRKAPLEIIGSCVAARDKAAS